MTTPFTVLHIRRWSKAERVSTTQTLFEIIFFVALLDDGDVRLARLDARHLLRTWKIAAPRFWQTLAQVSLGQIGKIVSAPTIPKLFGRLVNICAWLRHVLGAA